MARFRCVCGAQLSTSGEIPNPIEWNLLASSEWEDDPDTERLYFRSTLAYLCPESGHLWIFWRGFDADPSLYTPTDLPRPMVPRRSPGTS